VIEQIFRVLKYCAIEPLLYIIVLSTIVSQEWCAIRVWRVGFQS